MYGKGALSIEATGKIAAHRSSGQTSVGIRANSQAANGGMKVTVDKGASVEGDTGGIIVQSAGGGGITINNAGSVSITNASAGRFAGRPGAIDAKLTGDGDINITSSGTVTDASLNHWVSMPCIPAPTAARRKTATSPST
ncbi:hypothetical protein HZF05_17720 [Sphingomonas sp. CGMCC 1.13654]|uniref:Autotransporter outer membrane beta-barrel domain-containing protein n=2 Tax=Sphingomonas chungangi TaxID=2683589 RepID=A0A838L9H0_9SPHN|nr:hypothetical protein [Sphingomonas chungangi]MBA2935921.1 hypothetical protein [Sphingomonas chungangi]MVW54612.1 hypothetical protein [Sphingomonas chungangi]